MTFFRTSIACFFLLSILLLPFPWYFFALIQEGIDCFLLPYVRYFVPTTDTSSDTKGYLILLFTLFFVSILAGLFFKRFKNSDEKLDKYVSIFSIYYLSTVLLKYGFDKCFKQQFSLPEPNLLYTPLGQLDHDILFWSSMGSSYLFNLITGTIEVFAGTLLWFPKTRRVGFMLTLIVLGHILLINMSFDISVKFYTLFLLGLTVFTFRHEFRSWSLFLFGKESADLDSFNQRNTQLQLKSTLLAGLFPLLVIAETLTPHIVNGELNGDLEKKTPWHGAYEVKTVQNPKDSSWYSIQRIFFHRDQYLIFQTTDDEFLDFPYVITNGRNKIQLNLGENKFISFDLKTNTVSGELVLSSDEVTIKTERLNHKDLPLLNPSFHWLVDESIGQ
jgi:hypothetical protein